MTVSDESAGSDSTPPVQSKRPAKRHFRPLTPEQWKLAQLQFETSDESVTLAKLAVIFNTSRSSMEKHSANGKWSKGAKIVSDARRELQVATTKALATAAEKTGSEVARKLMDDLQPFIEREKRAQIKRAITRSKHGQKRLSSVAKGYQRFDAKSGEVVDLTPDPKDEMHIASAEEKYDAIIRRNLGMSDDKQAGGMISLRVLAGSAAIQVNQQPNEPAQ